MVGCSVPGCGSRTGKDGVKFYPIPALRENGPLPSREKFRRRRALWLSKLGKSGLLYEDTRMMVCNRHFISGKPSKPLDMNNADWVPYLNMPQVSQPDCDHSDHEPVCDKESDVGQEPVIGQEPDCCDDYSNIQPADEIPLDDIVEHSIQGPSAEEMDLSSSLCSDSCINTISGEMNSTFREDLANEKHVLDVPPLSDFFMDESCVRNDNVTNDIFVTDNIPVSQNLLSEHSQLLKSYSKLRDQLTELEVDKFDMSKSMSDLEEKCEIHEQKSRTFVSVCRGFDDKLKARDGRVKELEEQLEAANKRILDLEGAIKKYEVCSISFDRLKNDEKFLQFYTGLSNYKVFDIILTHVTNHVTDTTRSLEPWQCLLLTLMRLRLGVSLQDLAFRFDVSLTTISRVFEKWLYWLYVYLSPFINWPDRETLTATMPNSFKEEFGSNIAVIIDCFELFTERPGALDSRAMTWSNYKHHNTVKYLIGITPLGAVSFISEGWGGRVSDKHITANSGLYEKLLPGDVVMADRGFLIGEDLGFLCAKLLIPAFTRGQAQLSSHDISDTRKIASLRVHVERVIGLVKNKYRIMKSVLPSEFLCKKPGHAVPQIDEIVRVCCALTNLSPGIVTK